MRSLLADAEFSKKNRANHLSKNNRLNSIETVLIAEDLAVHPGGYFACEVTSASIFVVSN
jgi:hypothetical protein